MSVVDQAYRSSPATGRFSVIAKDGHVRKVAAKVTAVTPTSQLMSTTIGTVSREVNSSGMCFALDSGRDWIRFAVPQDQETHGRPFVALAYRAFGSADLQITTVQSDGKFYENAWPATIVAGRHVAVYPLDGQSFDSVQFSVTSGRVNLCVSGIAVIQPIWTSADANCSFVSAYGGVGPFTPCGERVESVKELSTLMSRPA